MKKHLIRRLFRKIRIKFKYKKTELPLAALKAIYRGKYAQSMQGNMIFAMRNPTFDDYMENYGTELAKFDTTPATAEETAAAESEWLESHGIKIDASKLKDRTTQEFYSTYQDLIEDWLDDEAPMDPAERKSYISTMIFGSK